MLMSSEFITLSENDMFQVNGGSIIGVLEPVHIKVLQI